MYKRLMNRFLFVGTIVAGSTGWFLAGFFSGWWVNSLDDISPYSRGMGAAMASTVCGEIAGKALSEEEGLKYVKGWLGKAAPREIELSQFHYGFNEVAEKHNCPTRI